MGEVDILVSSLSTDHDTNKMSECESFLKELKNACRILEEQKKEIHAKNY